MSQIIQPNPGFYEVHKLRNVDPVIFNPVRIIRSKSDVKVKKQMKYLEDKEVEILDIVFESEDDEDNLTSEEHEIQESHKSKRLVLQKYFAMTHEYSCKYLKEQLEDLNFRIQFLLQLETGTQIDLVDHWIKAERSPKHWQCYKFAKIFLKSLEKCLNYSIQTKISMDRSIWEHSTLTEFHQKIVESNGSLEDFNLEKMRKSFQRLKRYRNAAETNAPKADLFFDVVGSELVTLTEMSLACQREDKKQEMEVKRSRVKRKNIDRENSNWKIVGGCPEDLEDSGFNSGFTS